MGQRDTRDGQNSKKKVPPRSIPQPDNYSRISYLFEAAVHFSGSLKYDVLSRGLARNATMVSKKTVIRLSPSIKRSLCKKCHKVLLLGLNCDLRLENHSKKHKASADILVYRCVCGEKKRFPIGVDRNYVPFALREQDYEK